MRAVIKDLKRVQKALQAFVDSDGCDDIDCEDCIAAKKNGESVDLCDRIGWLNKDILQTLIDQRKKY